jgi:hypothetical protein
MVIKQQSIIGTQNKKRQDSKYTIPLQKNHQTTKQDRNTVSIKLLANY